MKTAPCVTRDMFLYHSWLADLASTVIGTHLQQRHPHAERLLNVDDNDLGTRSEDMNDSDQTQVGVMSAEAMYP